MGWSHGGLATSDSTTAALNAVPIQPSAPIPAPGAGHVLPLWYQHFCKSRNRRRQGWPLHFQPSRPGQYLRVSHLWLLGHLSRLWSCRGILWLFQRPSVQEDLGVAYITEWMANCTCSLSLYLECGELQRAVLRLIPFAPMVNIIGLVVGVVPEQYSFVSNFKDIDRLYPPIDDFISLSIVCCHWLVGQARLLLHLFWHTLKSFRTSHLGGRAKF